jgi:DNA-binding transcriptional LysR family regulator
MDLMQLEMFVAVYEERSFLRAAEKVCRTQTAVRAAVAKLEKEAGVRLLERRRGRQKDFHLTKAGELVYQYACRMIGLRNELGSVLLLGKGRPGERLRLGISEDWSSLWMGPLMERFRELRRHVRVEVRYGPSEALIREVREREIDLAILDAVPRLVQGNMETIWIPAIVHTSDSGQGQAAWLLRSRAGSCYASLEFEEYLNAFVCDLGAKRGMRKKAEKALLQKRQPGETNHSRNGTKDQSPGAVLQVAS